MNVVRQCYNSNSCLQHTRHSQQAYIRLTGCYCVPLAMNMLKVLDNPSTTMLNKRQLHNTDTHSSSRLVLLLPGLAAADHDRREWPVGRCVHLHIGDVIHDVHALQDATEDDVLAVEPVGANNGDEELAAVRVRAGIRHGDNTAAELQLQAHWLVGEGLAEDREAAGAVAALKVAALDHCRQGKEGGGRSSKHVRLSMLGDVRCWCPNTARACAVSRISD